MHLVKNINFDREVVKGANGYNWPRPSATCLLGQSVARKTLHHRQWKINNRVWLFIFIYFGGDHMICFKDIGGSIIVHGPIYYTMSV